MPLLYIFHKNIVCLHNALWCYVLQKKRCLNSFALLFAIYEGSAFFAGKKGVIRDTVLAHFSRSKAPALEFGTPACRQAGLLLIQEVQR